MKKEDLLKMSYSEAIEYFDSVEDKHELSCMLATLVNITQEYFKKLDDKELVEDAYSLGWTRAKVCDFDLVFMFLSFLK